MCRLCRCARQAAAKCLGQTCAQSFCTCCVHDGGAVKWHLQAFTGPRNLRHAVLEGLLLKCKLLCPQNGINYLSPTFNNTGYPPGPANVFHNGFLIHSRVLYPMSLLWTVSTQQTCAWP